ncbi:hypothetical protein PF005_g23730 [Phytophthora fragariae]|uniref:Uncharacterized protein n=1 Tax=Phytophthora fragariae TaxID=53985 RepID=A0A6A3WAL7_9STRA|nr:hypothetical protein PF005_g23730 [Phytophthora fragariae]KAE9187510.1 hypothetical protein PF004_g22772 [Phytophthora fragariae]
MSTAVPNLRTTPPPHRQIDHPHPAIFCDVWTNTTAKYAFKCEIYQDCVSSTRTQDNCWTKPLMCSKFTFEDDKELVQLVRSFVDAGTRVSWKDIGRKMTRTRHTATALQGRMQTLKRRVADRQP